MAGRVPEEEKRTVLYCSAAKTAAGEKKKKKKKKKGRDAGPNPASAAPVQVLPSVLTCTAFPRGKRKGGKEGRRTINPSPSAKRPRWGLVSGKERGGGGKKGKGDAFLAGSYAVPNNDGRVLYYDLSKEKGLVPTSTVTVLLGVEEKKKKKEEGPPNLPPSRLLSTAKGGGERRKRRQENGRNPLSGARPAARLVGPRGRRKRGGEEKGKGRVNTKQKRTYASTKEKEPAKGSPSRYIPAPTTKDSYVRRIYLGLKGKRKGNGNLWLLLCKVLFLRRMVQAGTKKKKKKGRKQESQPAPSQKEAANLSTGRCGIVREGREGKDRF